LAKLKLQQSTEEVDKVRGDEQGITKLLDKVLGFILKNWHDTSTSPVFPATQQLQGFFETPGNLQARFRVSLFSNPWGAEVEMPDLPW